MKRQAATAKGLKKRLGNLGLGAVCDPRVQGKVDHRLDTVLCALVVAMLTKARSQRDAELRTEQMRRKGDSALPIRARIADNTFGRLLPRLDHDSLRQCQHRLVKAEHRRAIRTRAVVAMASAPRGHRAAGGRLRWLCQRRGDGKVPL